jgi:excisionase family DNA binding protein
VIRWIKAGELRAVKLARQWRIAPADLAAYLERARVAPETR